MEKTVPHSYLCLITYELMKDPVMDPEGNTYERTAIEEWLTKQQVSPITRSELQISDLVPNRALRDVIEEFTRTYSDAIIIDERIKELDMRHIDNNISLDAHITEIKGEKYVSIDMISPEFTVPKNQDGTPYVSGIDYLLIIDKSGSMGAWAPTKDGDGNLEDSEYSVMDIVIHSVKTIIASCNDNDRICIVTYDVDSYINMNFTPMNSGGKSAANDIASKFFPSNCTNIWKGLHSSLELLRQYGLPDRMASVMFFTDASRQGLQSPPRGEGDMLKRYLEQYPDFKFTIDTFGFGNEIAEDILLSFSDQTFGSFKHIPSSDMVGTIFINHIATQRTIISKDIHIIIEPINSLPVGNVMGNYQIDKSEWGMSVNMISAKYETNKNLLFKIALPEDMEEHTPLYSVTLRYKNRYGELIENQIIVEYHPDKIEMGDISSYMQCYTIQELKRSMSSRDNSEQIRIINELIEYIESCDITPFKEPLLENLRGEIHLAFNGNMDSWGKYYIPSMIYALQHYDVLNFKDPVVQCFAGSYFNEIRDIVDDIFVNRIPVPKPCCKPYNAPKRARTYVALPRTDMSQYSNSGGGCFTGNTLIHTDLNNLKPISEIVKGDNVLTSNQKIAKVKCVIKFDIDSDIVIINNLGITPWHPIRKVNEYKWNFPITISKSIKSINNTVYNLVLESGHIIVSNGYECVTFGHGLEDDIVKHEFFGKNIIRELKRTKGWNNGFIHFKKNCFLQNKHEIIGIDFSMEY